VLFNAVPAPEPSGLLLVLAGCCALGVAKSKAARRANHAGRLR
jgi:hypothetical protein